MFNRCAVKHLLVIRRAKPTVRGLSSREITTRINPLTRSVNGHGKLIEELIGCG